MWIRSWWSPFLQQRNDEFLAVVPSLFRRSIFLLRLLSLKFLQNSFQWINTNKMFYEFCMQSYFVLHSWRAGDDAGKFSRWGREKIDRDYPVGVDWYVGCILVRTAHEVVLFDTKAYFDSDKCSNPTLAAMWHCAPFDRLNSFALGALGDRCQSSAFSLFFLSMSCFFFFGKRVSWFWLKIHTICTWWIYTSFLSLFDTRYLFRGYKKSNILVVGCTLSSTIFILVLKKSLGS